MFKGEEEGRGGGKIQPEVPHGYPLVRGVGEKGRREGKRMFIVCLSLCDRGKGKKKRGSSWKGEWPN